MKILDEKYLQKFSDWEAGRRSAKIPDDSKLKFKTCWGPYNGDALFVDEMNRTVKHITVVEKGGVEGYIIEYGDGENEGEVSGVWMASQLEWTLKLYREVAID